MASTNYTGPLYETFGTIQSGIAEAREINNEGEPVDIPDIELQTGLYGIEVRVYGDSLDNAFIRVVATHQQRATDVYEHTIDNLRENLKEWSKTDG